MSTDLGLLCATYNICILNSEAPNVTSQSILVIMKCSEEVKAIHQQLNKSVNQHNHSVTFFSLFMINPHTDYELINASALISWQIFICTCLHA